MMLGLKKKKVFEHVGPVRRRRIFLQMLHTETVTALSVY